MKNKNSKIQILRAAAIIAVVLIHTCPAGIEQVFVRPFLNFAVATFLFMSGYLTDISKTSVRAFYRKRIVRVLIPYAIWSIVYTTIGLLNSGELNLSKYLTNFLLGQGAATMYYIPVYIQFVLITPIAHKMAHGKKWWIGLLITPISYSYVYLVLFEFLPDNKIVSSLWHICCLGWFTYYYLGLLLRDKFKAVRYRTNRLIAFYALTLLLQMAEGYSWYRLGSNSAGTQLKVSTLLSNTVFIMLARCYIENVSIRSNNRLLILIGDYSFGIYLSHLAVIMLMRKLPFWNSIPFVINSAIVLSTTLLCLMICKKICGEKISRVLGII